MVLCEPIYIKSIPYYYQYYNNYINKTNNCESDKFIINSLKCKHKFLIPKFISKEELILNLKIEELKNKTSSTFIKEIPDTINNNPICSICLNKCHNRIFLGCYHSFCYKCLTEHINHQKINLKLKHRNNFDTISTFNEPTNNDNNNLMCINIDKFKRNKTIKCPICSSCVKSDNVYLLTPCEFQQKLLDNKIVNTLSGPQNINLKHFLGLLIFYSIGSDDYKEFLFKYIGIKTYHILNLIYLNKTPFKIENKKYSTYKIVISSSDKWVKIMNLLLNNPHQLDIKTINFINYNDFITLSKNNFITNDVNISNNNKIKFVFFFTELENVLQSNNIKTIISQIKNNMKHKLYSPFINSITFKQIIIKNTIDEKIFKNKIIIHK